MSAMQRTKGRAGEQEVARIIRGWLGLDIRRNWQGQAAQGGADLDGVPGWVIEVKRAKDPRLNDWWAQACEQALSVGAPALIYRLDGHGRGLPDEDKWQVQCYLSDVSDYEGRGAVTMTLRTWMEVVRDQMTGDTTRNLHSDAHKL